MVFSFWKMRESTLADDGVSLSVFAVQWPTWLGLHCTSQFLVIGGFASCKVDIL